MRGVFGGEKSSDRHLFEAILKMIEDSKAEFHKRSYVFNNLFHTLALHFAPKIICYTFHLSKRRVHSIPPSHLLLILYQAESIILRMEKPKNDF